MEKRITIGRRGTITIPARMRQEYGLKANDELIIEDSEHGIFLRSFCGLSARRRSSGIRKSGSQNLLATRGSAKWRQEHPDWEKVYLHRLYGRISGLQRVSTANEWIDRVLDGE